MTDALNKLNAVINDRKSNFQDEISIIDTAKLFIKNLPANLRNPEISPITGNVDILS